VYFQGFGLPWSNNSVANTLAFNQNICCMNHGIRKGLEDVAYELKGIRNILSSIWALQDGASQMSTTNPEAYADEYISTEECARRLGVSDQTLRNWIALGRRGDKTKGWIEGIHYVNVNPVPGTRTKIRVPWNHLVRSFVKNPKIKNTDYTFKHSEKAYKAQPYSIDAYLASLETDTDAENDDTIGASV